MRFIRSIKSRTLNFYLESSDSTIVAARANLKASQANAASMYMFSFISPASPRLLS